MSEVQADTAADSGNDRMIALIISFFIPGGGQFYQGRTKEGAAFLGGFILAFILGIVVSIVTLGFGILLLPVFIFIPWAVGLYDTYDQWLDI